MQGPMPPQQAPQMPPQSGAQPMPPGGAQPAGGPQPVQNIGFNQDVQNILFSRVQALTPEEVDAIDAGITPENLPAFIKLLPEMQMLLEQASAAGGDMEEGPIQGGMQGQPEEAQRNPLVNSNVSRGLMG